MTIPGFGLALVVTLIALSLVVGTGRITHANELCEHETPIAGAVPGAFYEASATIPPDSGARVAFIQIRFLDDTLDVVGESSESLGLLPIGPEGGTPFTAALAPPAATHYLVRLSVRVTDACTEGVLAPIQVSVTLPSTAPDPERPRRLLRGETASLLENGGFEQVEGEGFAGWGKRGGELATNGRHERQSGCVAHLHHDLDEVAAAGGAD